MSKPVRFLFALILLIAGAAVLLFARDSELSVFGVVSFDGLALGVVLAAVGCVDLVASILPTRRKR